MRSPRRTFEIACRVASFAVLGWLLGTSVIADRAVRVTRVDGRDLGARLGDLTRSTANVAIHATLPTIPPAWQGAWLAALQASRAPGAVSWSGNPTALAMSAEPVAQPDGGVRIDVAAPGGSVVHLADDASAIDSVHVADLGATVISPIAVGGLTASLALPRTSGISDTARRASPRVAQNAKTVIVLSKAGWEGRYVASALQEADWPVVTRFAVAPNVSVSGGAMPSLDTARVAAVVAIDSSALTLGADALARYVRSGGGLVLAGPAGSIASLAALAPGRLAARTRPATATETPVQLGSTGFYPVSLNEHGVAMERRGGAVAVAARRVGAGRVLQVGYDDSWRWRMAGVAGSEAAHRAWWSRIVASVAYAPTAPDTVDVAEAAPLASLVDQLGPSRALRAGFAKPPLDRRWWLALIFALLLAEWASRRLRGLR